MKLFFDFFPIILFFVAYKFFGIYVATATAIGATFAQIGWVWVTRRKVEPMLWISLVIIVVFGGATLLLRDDVFIKWKPTVLYWLFAGVLVLSQALFKKNLIAAMMRQQISLPEPVWKNLNLSWAGFFALMGAANLYVASTFSTDTWVNFKLFGSLGLMVLFVILQGLMLSKYIDKEVN